MPGRKRMTVLIIISFTITVALLSWLDSSAGLPGKAGASAAIVLFVLVFGILGAAAEKYHLL